MLDKIGHVKNPLSVIAMFAALAEVSGTAVLPLVEPATQLIYVKFLTFFPCFLVGLFFFTLWKYPTNLYAPSDYQNEDNFVVATARAVKAKLAEETQEGAIGHSPEEGNQADTAEAEEEAAQSYTAEPDEPEIIQPGSNSENQKALAAHAYLAEQLVIQNLERDLNLVFRRNVSPSNDRSVVFDAVSTNGIDGRLTIVEVRLISKRTPVSFVIKALARITDYLETETEAVRTNSKIILALVNRDMNARAAHGFIHQVRAHPGYKKGNVEIHLFALDDLIKPENGSLF